MRETLREERSRLWREMQKILPLAEAGHYREQRLYWRMADRVRIITKLLNKHNTDITSYRHGERCPDCELREAASSALWLAGSRNGKYDSHIRRHKWYRHKLSIGCETCKGRGRLIDGQA